MKRRTLSLTLVIIIIVGAIVGVTLWSKHRSVATLPSIVKSISPANRASGVEPDATVTINFRSAIWASLLPAPLEGEPLSLNSTELADRFRITNAATGEMVRGTITIEDGVKLIFKLPAGESWEPHTAYWIEGAVDTSLDEAWRERRWENLFLTEFTTEDLNENEFPVNHPFPGGWPDLLNDIAYDVDTSQSLSFEYLETRIKSAQSKADEANAQDQPGCSEINFLPDNRETVQVGQCSYDFVTKFHFWPNIINLTEVYYSEDDHALFDDIIDQLLEKEPNKAQLKSDLTAQVVRGDRVFSACDFITSLWYGFDRLTEVYYGMLINLDNPDETGVRRPYVQEILVHDYAAYGLSYLHDHHTEELVDMFNDPAGFPIGSGWDLCLRGNLKKNKYHAIIVDKLAEAPEAEFYIVRVHLNCFCNPFYDGPDSSVPDVPWKPPLPPEEEIPLPWEPQPFPNPNPPRNPHAPPNPKPDPDPARRPIPWPFPPDAIPLPQEDPIEPPADKLEPPDEEQAPEGCEQPPIDCSDKEDAADKLNETIERHEEAVSRRSKDLHTFNTTCRYDYELGWLEAIKTAEFDDPCLDELLKKLLEDLQPLLEEQAALDEQITGLHRQIRAVEDNMDPVLKVWKDRSGCWHDMLHEKGPWMNLTKHCQPMVGAGGHPVLVSEAEQAAFQKLIEDSIREGNTWEQAAQHAVKKTCAALPGGAASDAIGTFWHQYPHFLKMLYEEKFDVYLRWKYGDLTHDQLKAMKEVLFGKRLGEDQLREYRRIQGQVSELKNQRRELEDDLRKLISQMEERRKELWEKGIRCCFARSLQDNLRLLQLEKILESYLEWCKDRGDKFLAEWIEFDAPYIEGGFSRLCAVLCNIKDNEEFQGFEGLRSYATWVYNCLCGQHKCEDVVEPCDPECEDCADSIRPPAVSPEIAECAESSGYYIGFEDCLDGVFLTIDTGDYIEFMEYRLDAFLSSTNPDIPATECAQELIEFVDGAVECDQEWVANVFVESYLEAQETCRSQMTETEVLAAGLEASAQSIHDESGCHSTLTMTFTGQDLTGGSYPVTSVVLKVNGVTWHNSGTISTTYYQNSVSQQVGCGETFNIEVIATNQYGLTATAYKAITTPVP